MGLGCVSHTTYFRYQKRNQAGSSPAMEFMSFKLSMVYLINYGLTITTFISDRHTSIAKYMRTVLKQIIHYFDVWHLKKKIRKVLFKIAKEKDCEALNEWIKPCENHLHWSASSTYDGNGLVIWAKFKSFLQHIVNIHSGHSDPLFDKCAHGSNIPARKWLTIDSPLHNKVCAALTNKRLMNGIKKASPLAQTSCLEGFHSVLNHFAPKMIAYSYVGQYCRHILAVIHFNSNLQREKKTNPDKSERIKVSYPKFKNGEATIRSVRVAQNFDYVQEIYETFLSATEKDLKSKEVELKQMCPPAMNTMLNKQTKEEEVRKRNDRREMTIEDVPPSIPGL
ncbi:Hypothetical predicted protein [Paramuricea clavata]|uniref:Uncharacterized protein n=1 Tax=Paramuricea clavata TaxID=317549 RepID=A0A7D9E536_PARCT|nr:Hypothetical predicted protein [Paramuricea clavata]